MLRNKKLAAGLLAVAALGLMTPSTAEAARYRRVVRRAYAPVVVARPAVRVRAPYVGVAVGRGVSVRAPFVGVRVGW